MSKRLAELAGDYLAKTALAAGAVWKVWFDDMADQAAEMEAELDRLRRLERRCQDLDLVEPLLSGERLAVRVDWIDRKKARKP